jgi:glutamine amidotransferase
VSDAAAPREGVRPSVAVLDYGSGNVHSAVKALIAAGADARLTSDREEILAADGLVVPGVGAYRAVMEALRASRGDELIGRRLAGGRPVLGICVGMQVLFGRGVERGVDTEGLGEWPGVVTELDAPVLPHMGWNTVEPGEGSRLFAGIENERFYFVHSFGAQQWHLQVQPPFPSPTLTWCTYGAPFLAAVENGPLSATQFHPEKSGEAGIRLLSNWIGGLRAATL